MNEQKITIEIDREGRIRADAEGFSGDACLEALSRLLEDLGGDQAQIDRKEDTKKARRSITKKQTLGRKS